MKNKFKFLALAIMALLSVNVWATDYKDVVYTFGTSIPSGWTVNASTTAASGYLKLKSGETISTTAANLFGTELLCSKCSVEVSCGTFGTWKGTKSVTVTVDLLNQSQTVLSTASATFSSLSNSESAYKSAIIVDLPDDPSKIATLKITYTIPNSADVLRAKYVRLNYSTAAAEKYTVTFNAGSGTCSTSSLPESTAGAGVTLPAASPSSACGTDGWTFAGWATASQAETTTAPTLYAANSNYKPSSNCTLYAVYSKTESGGGGTPSLVKMAKGGTLADGDKIVIVANETTVALYQETTNNSYVNKWTFDNDIETVLGNDKNWLTVTATTDGFTLGDATNGYIYNSSNNLYCGETTADWELEDLDDGTFKLTTDGRYLSYRSDLSNQYWRMGGASGGTSGQTVLDIYKISASSGTTTYNSNPSCATCTNLITITKGTPSHGSFTLTGAGTDICADEPVTVNLSNITADTHYHATAVTTSATTGGGTPSAITDGSASVTGITASTTINVTFAEDTKVTVTLLNNNAPVEDSDLGFDAQGKKEYYTGETLGTLPTLTSSEACDETSNTFKGWTTEQITTKRAAAPVFVNASTTVTGNMTLRAVWARAE